MALREFTDSRGITWRAWDVPPARVYTPERSGAERRRQETPGHAPERRAGPERRRPSLNPGMERGWLCFECQDEKRRLAPPPSAWEASTDQDLESLCARALASLHPRRMQ